MKALYDDDGYVLATFPNKTTQKKIKRIIYAFFEPYFYEECCALDYDYLNDEQVKYEIKITTEDKIAYDVYGKAWDPKIEKELKRNPIKLSYYSPSGDISSDAVIRVLTFTVKELPKHEQKR